MSKIVVYMSMSLDGFIAAADDGPGAGLGIGGERLHAWLSAGNVDPTTHRPEQGVNAEVLDEMLETGAVITGRHTFEYAGDWGGDHHDGVPIFVVSHNPPDHSVGDLVHYLSDLESIATQAKSAAGERDVMMHGASSVQAFLRAGLIDEFAISLVPIVIGNGRRLFDDWPGELRLRQSREGEGVLHLRYEVINQG